MPPAVPVVTNESHSTNGGGSVNLWELTGLALLLVKRRSMQKRTRAGILNIPVNAADCGLDAP